MNHQDLRHQANKLLGNEIRFLIEVLNTNLQIEDLRAAEDLARHVLHECTRLRLAQEGSTDPS